MIREKTLGLFALSIFAFVFLMSFASAAVSFIPDSLSQQTSLGTTSTTLSFQINATADHNLSWSSSSLSQGSLTLPTLASISSGNTTSLSATLSGIPDDFIGNVTGNIVLTDSDDTSTTLDTLPFTVKVTAPTDVQDCVNTGLPSDVDVRIKKIDFTNNGMGTAQAYTKFGDDNSWFPFENIEVQIDVKNYGNIDTDNVEVGWGLYDIDRKEWVIEFDTEKDFRLKHDDTETLTLDFSINDNVDMDLSDITDGDHYRFYVTATGQIDDSDSVNDGADFCAYSSETPEIVIERDFVILDNIKVPETVQCGATVEVTSDAWNIGDHDQDDVSFEVYDQGNTLNIDKIVTVGNLDAADRQVTSFTFTVPKDAEEKSYSLVFNVLDENGDVFNTDFSDDDSTFTVPFKVSGNCGAAQPAVSVSTSLVSGGTAGKDLVIRATITNNGADLSTFTVNAAGFSEWADSATSDLSTIVLNKGESRDVTFTLPVKSSAEGQHTFIIEIVSGSDVIQQPVSVTIQPRGFLGFTGSAISGSALPWVVGILNIILIAIIIIVAVRIARR